MRILLRGLAVLVTAFPLAADPIDATFTGVNGDSAFGYYVGPYYGDLGTQAVVLDCVDFANDVYFGEQWYANLSSIETAQDLLNTRYGSLPDALQLYQEAAWLTQQYALNPRSDYADIQATIWQLFDPSAPSPSTNFWLYRAQANYMFGDYSDFFVVTNIGPVMPTGQVQEFLTVLDPSMPIYPDPPTNPGNVLATPEPPLMGMIGLGLVTIAVLARSWLRRPP